MLTLLALNTAKWQGERFTLTMDELLNLSVEERLKVEVLNKLTCESLADIKLTESSSWRTRGQIRLFYKKLLNDLPHSF